VLPEEFVEHTPIRVDDLLVRFAKCCSPVPGDGIVGFITRGRGLTVHARDCLTVVKNVLDKERFITVEWDGGAPTKRPVRIAVYIGQDRPGLLAEITGAISSRHGNITKAEVTVTEDRRGLNHFVVEVDDLRQLQEIQAVLEMTDLSRDEQSKKLEALLDEFNLHHVRKNNGDSLSGGERRRTEIARALAVDPKFILLDEPFAGVDPIAVEDIQAVVARLKYKNIGILITDHNVNETLSICDRAYLLIEGKIFKHGTAEELAADEQVRRLYLGRNFELKRKDYLHEEASRPVI
jgi:lipopolysaccharide export system ATP-binding protein